MDIRQSPVGALWHLLPDRHRAGIGIFDFQSAGGIYTELQCGSHFFMDADYGRNLDRDSAGGRLPSPHQLLARRDDPLGEAEVSIRHPRLLRKSGRCQWSRYGYRKDKRGAHAPGNDLILAKSQPNIIAVELTADGLTVDDSSEGAAEVSHMITFAALLDHEVIAR